MIDPNFTHIKYNNFPDEIVKEIIAIANNKFNNKFEQNINIFEIKEPRPGENYTDPIPFYSNKIISLNGVDFKLLYLVSLRNSGMSCVHVDRNRNFGLNIPVQVDLIEGCTLVFEGDDYDRLGKFVTTAPWGPPAYPGETDISDTGKFWLYAEEKEMTKVQLDKPILLNTGRPHSWINNSNNNRIIATLSVDEEIYNLDRVVEALNPFI